MKKLTTSIFALVLISLSACGGGGEDNAKKIEDAAAMRAKQVCESGDYEQKLNYLTEQLTEQGITEQADVDKAIELFNNKVKESCPDKHPDGGGTPVEPEPETEDTTADTTVAAE
ncbi:MAG TPA: hypothetical protein VK177_20375 [Flavobacteriales bacterium]|nr:hypothetical protein [Flavobacteriales bacterium]